MAKTSKKGFTEVQVIVLLNKQFKGAFEWLKKIKKGVIYCKLNSKEKLLDISKFLKTHLNFKYPVSITALDWIEHYELVYHIFSYENNNLIEVHVNVSKDDPSVDSVVRVWKGANYHEREAYDMMGIKFNNHPELFRILLPEEVDYHPLRKDFPLAGEKVDGLLPFQIIGKLKIR